VWHNQGVSGEKRVRQAAERGRKERPALDHERLRELALRYVGRFATTRSKLRDYLRRKLRERGWSAPEEPDIDGLIARLVDLGYVDDAVFALNKANSLSARGYGEGRLRQALHAAGVGEDDAAGARDSASAQATEAALRFARRKRIGPWAAERGDQAARQKALAAMVRAGHSFTISKVLVDADPGAELSPGELSDLCS
jgi:regulatory protein